MEKSTTASVKDNGKLAPWNRAAAALPLLDVLRAPLAMPRLWAGRTECPMRPLVIATRPDVKPDFEMEFAGNPFEAKFERLNADSAVKCVRALWPSSEGTEVAIIGPEAEALMDLRVNVKPSKDISEFLNPRGWKSQDKLELSFRHASQWKREMLAGLRAYIKPRELDSLPPTILDCVSNSDAEAMVLGAIISKPEFLAERYEMDAFSMKNVHKGVKAELYERLERACDAYVVAYVLNCAAKILTEEEIAGFRAIETFGLGPVQNYAGLSNALANRPPKPNRLVGRMLEFVGHDVEDEVRDAFGVPKAVVVAVAAPAELPRPAAPVPHAPPEQPMRKAPEYSKERLASLLKTLDGVPVAFVRQCFQQGVRDAESIIERYTSPKSETREPRDVHRRFSRIPDAPAEAAGGGRARPRTLEERAAAIRFDGRIDAQIRRNGIEPEQVSFLICKIFGYPHSGVRSYNEADARSELRRHLNGARGAGKTVDGVFHFMYGAELIKMNGKAARSEVIMLNAGTGNPLGQGIFATIRENFEE